MTNDIITEEIRQFLSKHIDSVAQWEGLLLVKTQHGLEWNAGLIARHLYLSEAEAARLLADLAAQGFLAATGNKSKLVYRYRPKSPELDSLVDRTAELYRRYLIPITQFIHSKPKTRIQEFADAFRIRKD